MKLPAVVLAILLPIVLCAGIPTTAWSSGPGGELAELALMRQQAEVEKANKLLVQRWLDDLWDQGRFAVAEELLAPDFRRHSEGFPATGPAEYAAIVKSCHDGFPDTRIVRVDELLADGDRVFVRWRWTGTHTGEFRGIAPTGRAIDVLGEDVIRIEDGRITEIWPLFDPLRLMLQLGVINEAMPPG